MVLQLRVVTGTPNSLSIWPRARFPNDKRACCAYIHNVIVAQFSCQDAWAKRPVPAHVDTSQENDESHELPLYITYLTIKGRAFGVAAMSSRNEKNEGDRGACGRPSTVLIGGEGTRPREDTEI